MGLFGFLIHDYHDKKLKLFYISQVITGALSVIFGYWNIRLTIIYEPNQEYSNVKELEEHQQHPNTQLQRVDVLHFYQPNDLKGRQITISSSAITIRPHILFCIVRNINLAMDENLMKLLHLQNKLHDEICEKRTLATIGLHDLSLISEYLFYDARDPTEINFIPLGKDSQLISAKTFYDQLCEEIERERKLEEQNEIPDLHKYLLLLQNQNVFPCLSDQNGHVLSIPPLTTAERSKLSSLTESVLIEITSGHSIDICYRIMDLILREMLRLKLGQNTNGSNLQQILTVQQTRVVDEEGQLRITFPSRTHLDWKEISQEIILIDSLTSDN